MTEEYEEYSKMLSEIDSFQGVSSEAGEDDNFFSIAGYPHYENVVSNILGFFFKSDEVHGMGDLWISSLIECYKQKNNVEIEDQTVLSTEREFRCDDEKRIDLILQMSDSVIVIENKIWSIPSNPWKIYHNTVTRQYSNVLNGKKPMEILLSIKQEQDIIKEDYAFYNIIYEELLDRVQSKIGRYLNSIDYKWLVFMNEFVMNLRRLIMGTKNEIEVKWQEYLVKNGESISKLLKVHKADLRNKHNVLKEIKNQVESYCDAENIVVSGIALYRPDSYDSSYSSTVIDILVDEKYKLVIEPYIMNEYTGEKHESMTSLYLPVWCRQPFNKSYNFSDLLAKLEPDFPDIDKRDVHTDIWGNWYMAKEYDLTKELEIGDVVEDIKKIITEVKKL